MLLAAAQAPAWWSLAAGALMYAVVMVNWWRKGRHGD